MRIELIYDEDCPNAGAARQSLEAALTQAGLPCRWIEWERSDPAAPPSVRKWGSPTILIDHADAGGATSGGGMSCRVYPDDRGGMRASPSTGMILSALQRRSRTAGERPLKRPVTVMARETASTFDSRVP